MRSFNRYFYKILLHVLFPLITGGIIYLYGRHNTWLNKHLDFLNFSSNNKSLNNWENGMLIYNVPDFCWDYSFASALFIWNLKTASGGKYFPLAILLLLISSECIQIFLPYTFTFDWLDMIAAMLAFCLSCYLNYSK